MKFAALKFAACALLLGGVSASAQIIETAPLSQAVPYDAAILTPDNGGLDQRLWAGANTDAATQLLAESPVDSSHPVARALIRAVILSGGIPPEATESTSISEFRRERFRTVLRLGDMHAAQLMLRQNGVLSADPAVQADMALIGGDFEGACDIADARREGRADPYWARLRAFCHILRDEVPAAELTIDLLQSSGYADDNYYALAAFLSGAPGTPRLKEAGFDPLIMAMINKAGVSWPSGRRPYVSAAAIAMDTLADPADRLAALYGAGPALSDDQVISVLENLADSSASPDNALAGGSEPDLDDLKNMQNAEGTGKLFVMARDGGQADRPRAVAELLRRAAKAGAFDRMAAFLTPIIRTLSPEEQMLTDREIFIAAALERRDIPALQQFYRLTEDNEALQERLALATDALGFGFMGGGLGSDIEARLAGAASAKPRAVRDVFIATALGASLSDNARRHLGNSAPIDAEMRMGALLSLKAASRNGAQAETALRAAELLSDGRLDDFSIHLVMDALQSVGLAAYASQIGALDFWDGS